MCLQSTLGEDHGSGHFYFAKNRTFLLCVDMTLADMTLVDVSWRCRSGTRLADADSEFHSRGTCASVTVEQANLMFFEAIERGAAVFEPVSEFSLLDSFLFRMSIQSADGDAEIPCGLGMGEPRRV
jgi:hypothetical protein